jgi:peptidoglycan-associated lipoprotein
MRIKWIAPLAIALLLAACESTPEDSNASNTDGATATEVSDSSGGADTMDVDTAETQVASVDSDGPIPGSQEDLVQNVGDRVFFKLDSAVLSPEARRTLERQADWLRLFPNLRVTIEGHADERGTREYNLALGERRANAVREYLSALGVDASRTRTISYGKERPYALGHNEESWSLNRRSVSVVN